MGKIIITILLSLALLALLLSLLILYRAPERQNGAPIPIEIPSSKQSSRHPQEREEPLATPPPLDYEESLPREIYVTPEPTPDRALERKQIPPTDRPLKPAIAVVIDDMGVDRRRSARAVALPGSITLAYLPYAEQLPIQTKRAKAAGHELLIHVPMEPSSPHVDPGPNVLEVDDSAQEIRRKLQWALSRFEGYVGINNHMGSRFTADAAAMKIVMEELRGRNLLFLDSRTIALSQAMTAALESDVPFLTRNVFLDHVEERSAIEEQLRAVEDLAIKRGYAVAIGHPRDGTLEALEAWLPTLAAKGIDLVPISLLLERQTLLAD